MVRVMRDLCTRLIARLRRSHAPVREGRDGSTDDGTFGPGSTHPNGFFRRGDADRRTALRGGRVSLVGAGPGDPGLLTLKGKRRLEEADVIIYDYLVNASLLMHGRPGVECIPVGKPGSAGRLSQEEINDLLIGRAREGGMVVRLKGGDPFIFSRGGEEAEALAAAGIPYEVVPGVTSAIAVPAYAGIPLTHRHLASSVAFVTGQENPGKEESGIDWKAVAHTGTVVFLMGVGRLPQIVGRLIEEGRSPDTPVAVIRWGTWNRQEAVTGTLQDIREKAKGIGPPAVIVVGDVVRLRNHLQWVGEDPASRGETTATQQHAGAVNLPDA